MQALSMGGAFLSLFWAVLLVVASWGEHVGSPIGLAVVVSAFVFLSGVCARQAFR